MLNASNNVSRSANRRSKISRRLQALMGFDQRIGIRGLSNQWVDLLFDVVDTGPSLKGTCFHEQQVEGFRMVY